MDEAVDGDAAEGVAADEDEDVGVKGEEGASESNFTSQTGGDVGVERAGVGLMVVKPTANSRISAPAAKKVTGAPSWLPNPMMTGTKPTTTDRGALKASTVNTTSVVPMLPLRRCGCGPVSVASVVCSAWLSSVVIGLPCLLVGIG